MPRPRRKSSNLGSDLRGDTGAAALSTLEPTPTFNSPPLTPVITHPCLVRSLIANLYRSAHGTPHPSPSAHFQSDEKPNPSSGAGKPSPSATHG